MDPDSNLIFEDLQFDDDDESNSRHGVSIVIDDGINSQMPSTDLNSDQLRNISTKGGRLLGDPAINRVFFEINEPLHGFGPKGAKVGDSL